MTDILNTLVADTDNNGVCYTCDVATATAPETRSARAG